LANLTLRSTSLKEAHFRKMAICSKNIPKQKLSENIFHKKIAREGTAGLALQTERSGQGYHGTIRVFDLAVNLW
jgi:hypothetical protein